MSNLTTADNIALYVGGGLVILGTFVIGLLDMLFGAGHPVGGDGQIEHDAVIPLEIRSMIILLGLLVWGVYAVYRVVAGPPQAGGTSI
ncbi:MAG: hypothetical protein ACLFMX_05610 [Halobacteriales archaeon]